MWGRKKGANKGEDKLKHLARWKVTETVVNKVREGCQWG